MLRTHLPVLFLTTLLGADAIAQEWYLEQPGTAPAARRFHTIAHVGGHEVLFGGANERLDIVHGDTWRYDGLSWTYVTSAGPGPRQRFAACSDGNRDLLVVFGGSDATGQVLGDTWLFDGSSWLPQVTAGAPSPRLGAAMAFDRARNRAVLFGGGATTSAPNAETWEFDGVTWTQRTPAVAPSARQGHAMTYDTTRNVVLLFGGFTNGAFAADTWQWDGTTWTPVVTATVPPASPFPALTFFEPHGVAVLTAGSGVASQPLATWVFDGTDWAAGPGAPAGFSSRQGQAMAYDRVREMVVLFGGARVGIGGAIPSADTWELSIRALAEPFGSGCAFSGGQPALTAVGGSRPQLGSTFQAEVAPAGALALFVVGLSDATYLGAPLPADLSVIGLPGCELFTSIDDAVLAPVSGGAAAFALAVPLQRALLGVQFFVQAIVADPAAPVSAAASNALRATVGN